MSEVEQLAQEQFNTFKNRLCEILSEIEEEHKSAFMYGYAQGETDEKFRTKQVVTKENADLEKENAELRKEISVLLSCKNCPENKGGYICQKEYENKCLAQKIQYIKELQQENAELEEENAELEEENAELKAQIEKMKCCGNCANLCGCGLRGYEECKNFDKWEIREK